MSQATIRVMVRLVVKANGMSQAIIRVMVRVRVRLIVKANGMSQATIRVRARARVRLIVKANGISQACEPRMTAKGAPNCAVNSESQA